jgi:hypothetical protein
VKVRGIGFAEAVQALTYGIPPPYTQEKTLSPKIIPAKQAKPFSLPPPSANNDRVYAYLRGRGIGNDIINRCFRTGILYESKAHRCVFVGKDGDIPRFACERGTADDCKRDVPGSSKRFSFCLPPSTLDGGRNLAVFESAIDCIAHFEIHRLGQTGWDGYRLALGGVGSAALDGFMERHTDIENVQLCLDADQAGINAAKRITAELLSDKRFARTKICVAPPPLGKDYSDCLQAIHETNKAKTITDRQRAVFSM